MNVCGKKKKKSLKTVMKKSNPSLNNIKFYNSKIFNGSKAHAMGSVSLDAGCCPFNFFLEVTFIFISESDASNGVLERQRRR